MINLHGDQIKYQANINKTMRIDKKQKKKEHGERLKKEREDDEVIIS